MPALRLFGGLVAYYALLALGVVATALFPELAENLPVGRVQALLAQAGESTPLEEFAGHAPARGPNGVAPSFLGSLVWLTAAILGALAAAMPVSRVYMAVRNPDEYDQSLVDTIVVLPLVVTMIVVVVQHSLALAFSLAGIAGAARYRNSMKSSGDLLFILLSIGIGLSAGIGAVELALVGSAAFNFAFLALWVTRYGERQAMKRYMGGYVQGDVAPEGEHHGKKHKKDKKRGAALAEDSPTENVPDADPAPGPPAVLPPAP